MCTFHHLKRNRKPSVINSNWLHQENTTKSSSLKPHQHHQSHSKLQPHKHNLKRKLSFTCWLRNQKKHLSDLDPKHQFNCQFRNQKFTSSSTKHRRRQEERLMEVTHMDMDIVEAALVLVVLLQTVLLTSKSQIHLQLMEHPSKSKQMTTLTVLCDKHRSKIIYGPRSHL